MVDKEQIKKAIELDMDENDKLYKNNLIRRYINSVLTDVGIDRFVFTFSEDEEKNNDLEMGWHDFVKENNLLHIANVIMDKVLCSSKGMLVQRKSKDGFSLIDGELLSVEKVSEDYEFVNNRDLILRNEGKEIDTISNLWIYYARQDIETRPIKNSYTYSYLDIWLPAALQLEVLYNNLTSEVMKSNTIVVKSPEVASPDASPKEREETLKSARAVTTATKEGKPVLLSSETEMSQFSYSGKLVFEGITTTLELLSILSAIPLSQLKELTFGGLNASGDAINDNANYIKLISKMQDIAQKIWLFFVKSYLEEEDPRLAYNLHKIVVSPPEIHKMKIEQLFDFAERLIEIEQKDPARAKRYSVLHDSIIEKMTARIK